ncbi:DUF3570 domain-containing protein [Glaciecola petra]|uniref:DUF3570 domain-containing protein n=1 Tax=Glaciecola petra TaxID=3075602 RepID=A0ABU2ZTX1_9ALTE|nr:DUF3570 domain-containing protein [Aestuariibacter sp. P117]MDT0595024.1 DUF3570 domain-containing protein [Aestuariibacter sp. P117]
MHCKQRDLTHNSLIKLLPFIGMLASLIFASFLSYASVLPEDRSDVMYHAYEGDGVSIDGPSILLRKQIGNHVSVSANYYADTVSGASIDVRATASEYQEERKETTIGTDFLHEKSLLSLSYTNSTENDFVANSVYVGLSQSFFGDLTTLTMSYSKGWDEVMKRGDESFFEEADRQKFGIGVSQIMSKSLIVGFNAEHVSDEGYLNNPYRSIRYRDADSDRGFSFTTELYPNTRSSTAYSINANYYLPYRAALYADARMYSDSWGIEARNGRIGYLQPYKNFLLDVFVRYYSQEGADFYRDLFDRPNQFNFMARDKEMSTYNGLTAGVSLSYEWKFSETATIKKSSFHVEVDYMKFDYDNFRDVTADAPIGEEPLFGFNASALKIYASIWY